MSKSRPILHKGQSVPPAKPSSVGNIQKQQPVFTFVVTDHSDDHKGSGIRLRQGNSRSRSPSPYSQDLGTFAMPFIDPEGGESGMTDSGEYRTGRPRSSSGASALKGFLSSGSHGKSKTRNKSQERDEKEKKDKEKKKGGFFEAFRPRSKSDVSGMKRPVRKPAIPTEHSADESGLNVTHTISPVGAHNKRPYGGSQELSSPMGQILEDQMLHVGSDERNRHKSGGLPPPLKEGGLMSKFRMRSNSDSKPRSPRRPVISQRSISPPHSPLEDQALLSPLKLQGGEPRSAPPGYHRTGSLPNSEHTHAMLHRMSVDSDRIEIDDLDENEDQVYSKFMRAHRCYDLIPTSAKLVIFDTQLNVKKAFFALVYNGVRAAPLWDSTRQNYVGMVTVTDFINMLQRYYRSPDRRMDELEDHKICNWRELLETERPLVSIGPDASLYDAVMSLTNHHVHRLPVIDENTGNALFILTHKRILRFLHLFIKDLPKPAFMTKTIGDLRIGTYENVITATSEMPLIEALNLFVEHRISALPVLDESGQVSSIYAKFDVINLAADKSYNNLDVTLGEALRQRHSENLEPPAVATCLLTDTVGYVIEKIVKAEVHRLVVTDEYNSIEGILSLSDLLKYIVLRPILEAEENETSNSTSPPTATEPENMIS